MNLSNNPGYPQTWDRCMKYHFVDDTVITQCSDYSRNFLKQHVNQINNGIIVEIGVFGGATLLDLYDLCKQNNNKLIGIDPFDKINIYNGIDATNVSDKMKNIVKLTFLKNKNNLNNIISKYSLDDIITIKYDESWKVHDEFENNSINVLHIDGDHSTDGIYKDLKLYWPKMINNGIIIGDDYKWFSVQCGLQKFCEEFDLKFSLCDHGEKFLIYKK